MNQTEAIAPMNCACRILRLVPRENPDGTRSDRWLCATCNLDFGNVKLAIPPPPQPASDAEIEAWREEGVGRVIPPGDWLDRGVALMRRAATPSSGRLRDEMLDTDENTALSHWVECVGNILGVLAKRDGAK